MRAKDDDDDRAMEKAKKMSAVAVGGSLNVMNLEDKKGVAFDRHDECHATRDDDRIGICWKWVEP